MCACVCVCWIAGIANPCGMQNEKHGAIEIDGRVIEKEAKHTHTRTR